MDLTFKAALEAAGADPDLLVKVAEEANDKDSKASLTAAERAANLRPSARASFLLGEGLRNEAIFAEASEKSGFLERAERAFRMAIHLAKAPGAEMYFGWQTYLRTGALRKKLSRIFSMHFEQVRGWTEPLKCGLTAFVDWRGQPLH